MSGFREQFDAAQSPQSAAFSLKLGHVYNAFIASPAVPLTVTREDSSTNTALDAYAVQRTSAGTPGTGIGVGLAFNVETSVNNIEIGAAIRAVTTDVAAGSEDFDLVFYTMRNGAPAAARARIDSKGLASIGEGGGRFTGADCRFQVAADTGADFVAHFNGYGNNSFGIVNVYSKTRNGSPTGHTVVQNNDSVMYLDSWASDGSDYYNLAQVLTEIDGTPGPNDMPGRLRVLLSPDGSASPAECIRIDNQGRVSYKAGSTLTISGGVLAAPNGVVVTIDTEGAAASDDLDTIGTTGVTDTTIIYVKAANDARTVVCKDGTGNLRLAGDFSLDHTDDRLMLMYNGASWVEVSRSDNTA